VKAVSSFHRVAVHGREAGDPAEHVCEKERAMGKALFPVVVLIVLVMLVQLVVQRGITARYDYRCGSCGQTFSLAPTSAVVAPHRLGGSKYVKCPHCGARTWAARVPKQ
jgi:DNA-directed RNA polymerase subunit RPC12/RpoP